jgi:hypothetical protein
MSGFEVAGVVLASLPLIISALEHYAEGIATAKRFWRYKTEMRSLILQIDTERGIFINTLEQLLTGIVRIDRMADFLSKPGGDAWRDSDVDPKLKERLRGAYSIYIDNVRGMEVSLRQMMEKLALGANGKVRASASLIDRSSGEHGWRYAMSSVEKSCVAKRIVILSASPSIQGP